MAGADSEAALESWMGELPDGLILDGTVAQSEKQAAELWSLRESISESLSATGLPHKNDIALPIAALEAFCAELDAVFARDYAGWEICLFGHIGDGNLHVNVMKPDDLDKEAFLRRTHEAARRSKEANDWYTRAAGYGQTFYGQLAARKVPNAGTKLPTDPIASATDQQALGGRELVTMARYLGQAGDYERTRVLPPLPESAQGSDA